MLKSMYLLNLNKLFMKRCFRLFILLLSVTTLFSCTENELEVTNQIWFEIKSTSIHIGQSTDLVLSSDLKDANITWYSSDSAIATVSEEGVVTAESLGTVNIIATTTSGHTAACEVVVSPEIFLLINELTVDVGEEYEISYYITPSYSTETAVTWTSSSTSVATVEGVEADDDDEDADTSVGSAIITGVSETGETTITVSLSSGSYAECVVNVDIIPLESFTVENNYNSFVIGNKRPLTITYTPTDATYKTLSWESSDESIVTVSEGTMTAVKDGEAYITATYTYGDSDEPLTSSCYVKVALNGLSLSSTSIKTLPGVTIDNLTLTYLTGSDAYTKASWDSSSPEVATVDCESGENVATIEALTIGQTTITATSEDSDIEVTCTVDVVDITEFITLSYEKLEKEEYSNSILTATLSSPSIKNSSTQSCEIVSFSIQTYVENLLDIDHYTKDFTSITLAAGESYTLAEDIDINGYYNPRCVWGVKWNGTTYYVTSNLWE